MISGTLTVTLFPGLRNGTWIYNSWEDNLKTLLTKWIPSKPASLCHRKRGCVPATHVVSVVWSCEYGYSGKSFLLGESCPRDLHVLETQTLRAFVAPRAQNSHPPVLIISCSTEQHPRSYQKMKRMMWVWSRGRAGRRLGLSSGPKERGVDCPHHVLDSRLPHRP